MKKVNPKDLNRLIGNQVYKVRVARKLSQEKLAELVDVSRVTISQIENGNKSAKISTYYHIACALDIPLYELFQWEDNNKKISNDILFLLSDCSSNEITAYTEILRAMKLQLSSMNIKNERRVFIANN